MDISFDEIFTPKEQEMQKQAKPDLTQMWFSSMQQSVGSENLQKSAATTQATEEELGKQAAAETMADLDGMVKQAVYDMFTEEAMKVAEADYYGRMYAHAYWKGYTKAAEMDGVQMKRDKPEDNQGIPTNREETVNAPPATMGEGIAYLASHIAKKTVGEASTPANLDGPAKIIQTPGDGFSA